MYNIHPIAPCMYEIQKKGNMLVPGLIVASESLLQDKGLKEPLEQVCNVATLPGIQGYSIAMPDMHWGYGFPIGGVAAMDKDTGVISPGGVGYDINCGVRLCIIKHPFASFSDKTKKTLLDYLFTSIPSGVGKNQHGKALTDEDYKKLFRLGARWAVDQGYGVEKDIEHTENCGILPGADFDDISILAKERGKHQLGTIGSGNHFIEIGEVESIFLPDIALAWDVAAKYTYILIHSGSRGFGHQVCQDTLNMFVKEGLANELPDKQLACAPIQSEMGQHYLRAMAAAANYAFNNRQYILHAVREAFYNVCNIKHEEVRLLYDVCHNIAKFEKHIVKGNIKTLCVHRKGATRAFGKEHPELSPFFQQTGQPVIVPGDMGRASHLLVGCGNPLTWCSCCHGAGRARSRMKSMQEWKGKDVDSYMKNQGVLVRSSSFKTVAEEMPDAYKDVDEVVDCVERAGLAKKVAKLRPRLVIKG